MIKNIIDIIRTQTNEMDNLEFYKYWLDNFVVKNKETGKEILKFFKVHNLDTLFIKIKKLG